MLKSRVSSKPDFSRLAKAMERPGIDPRCWICTGYVETFAIDEEGPFVDVILMPDERPETARVSSIYSGVGFGVFMPLEKDDEVLVAAPNGDPQEGLVVIARLFSKSDPPPQSALDSNGTDLIVHAKEGANINIIVSGGGTINLGESNLSAQEGVVNGQGIDSFSGSTYFALGNASAVVKAKK